MSTEKPHRMACGDAFKKKAERVAALLNYDSWYCSVSAGLDMISEYAEDNIKGNTNYVFCTPEIDSLVTNNPEFIKALCEPGVVEWLTPFVLTKSKQVATANNSTPTST